MLKLLGCPGLLVLALLSLASSPTVADTDTRLVVNTGFTPPISTLFNRILEEALRRVGLTLEFQAMPAERSLILVASGVDDAECCRIPEVVLKDYPDLVTVRESVFEVRFSAFTRNPAIEIAGWEDLVPYSVATVTGWKILVNNIERIQPRDHFILDTPEAMFQMLALDRIDIATFGYLSGLEVVRRLELDDVRVLKPPLATRALYLMLNKEHAHLAPAFERVLREMKQEGALRRIVDDVIGESS